MSEGASDEVLDRVAAELARAEHVLFMTGAGLSADSGLPTYRGVGGLYEQDDTDAGIPVEQALSGPMLERDPALVWRHLFEIEEACRGARPNRGHEVIAELERTGRRIVTITQNVDGFHRDAGSEELIELHGRIDTLLCTSAACDWSERVGSWEGLSRPVPRCPRCGELVRPDVVLFGEMLPSEAVARMQAELERGFDLVFSVGTSSLFPYIVAPVVEAARSGVPTVEINPARTDVSELVAHRIDEGAAGALDAVLRKLHALEG